MKQAYSTEEKKHILATLKIVPARGLVSSGQAAAILSHRAYRETGQVHAYQSDALRQRVRKGRLRSLYVNNRISLYGVDDIFNIELHPQKWHSVRGKNGASPR